MSLRERITLANKHCVYFSIPKNASTSLKAVINDIEKMLWLGDIKARELEQRNNRLPKSRSNLLCIRLMDELPESWGSLFKFSVVRNPWDRFISSWHHIMEMDKKKYSLLEIIDMAKKKRERKEYDSKQGWHLSGQFEHLSDRNGIFQMDRIIRFENLQTEFNELLTSIGENIVKLPHKNKTEHKHYTEYYNEETIERVYQIYKDDIGYFGYEFGE